MHFDLIDGVLERSDDRIVVVKQVSQAEEYLKEHFPGFAVLPGVMMVETMVQAARRLMADRGVPRLVLGEVRALKFGAMVRPGEALEVEVTVKGPDDDGQFTCRGTGKVRRSDGVTASETAASGRFTMRPLRTTATA